MHAAILPLERYLDWLNEPLDQAWQFLRTYPAERLQAQISIQEGST